MNSHVELLFAIYMSSISTCINIVFLLLLALIFYGQFLKAQKAHFISHPSVAHPYGILLYNKTEKLYRTELVYIVSSGREREVGQLVVFNRNTFPGNVQKSHKTNRSTQVHTGFNEEA